MKRVLIISPHFPPVNAPDHQRVRMALPYFQEQGWETRVIAVDPRDVEAPTDPFLETTLPAGARVERVRAWPASLTRRFGIGSLALRSLRSIQKAGEACLRREKVDLVFFSTTLFPVTLLGPYWKRKFKVPYVVDVQDPWRSDYRYDGRQRLAPGGAFKYGLSQQLAAWGEPRVLGDAAALISVSPAYPAQWRKRYPWSSQIPVTVLPFGAPERDFELLNVREAPVLDSRFTHWVYVGRGGDDMAVALRGFFKALQRARREKPAETERLRVHFLGTDYAPSGKGRATILPLAQAEGVGDLVIEKTDRMPYGKALGWLKAANALIIPGSDDPGYTASKLFPYVLARKPMLAIFHEASSVGKILEEVSVGTIVRFADRTSSDALADMIHAAWFGPASLTARIPDAQVLERYSARTMTRTLAAVFDGAIRTGVPS